ncbi:NAD(P)-dependent oxidoreductase [Acidisoma cellulosilytica]|uniref:NAD(P)-dependent oxidoreductase n=1 Tax=Acidisoma cellulosilyticum TaxID=2802395 RepID=A0A963YYN5_9PROT|nr:NAD(P)-dependent oxidoreductase [Acidisoma cellulosilyticum]MCB8879574.1 NAD(P)-dependent oxidoreductase [Acidisoma cellulosilyticum]
MAVAIIAPGAMGAAIGQRLVENGVEVRTSLTGRSPSSRQRAEAAGLQPVSDEAIAACDFILSIVPPGEALALATRLAPVLAQTTHRPVYVDCNAISPATAQTVSMAFPSPQVRFVDGSIIGGPPKPGTRGPSLYVSGADATALTALNAHGLVVKLLDDRIGSASALKMSYAGITKGLTALGSAMILAAGRHGAAEALRAELAESQPELLQRFAQSVPDMAPKAYRWVAEMEEIADFAGEDAAIRDIYLGMARLYADLAEDQAGDKAKAAHLRAFLQGS